MSGAVYKAFNTSRPEFYAHCGWTRLRFKIVVSKTECVLLLCCYFVTFYHNILLIIYLFVCPLMWTEICFNKR